MDIELLLSQFCDYSLYFLGYSKFTITRYKSVVGFYSRFADLKMIEEVSEDNIRAFFFYGRTSREWKPNTYITFHMTLSVFFQWCVQQKYLSKNPMKEIEMPKSEKKLPPKLTKQESMRLLEIVYNYPYDTKFLRYRNHAIFSTFIFAGLRKSELLKLRVTDVDVENLTIFVNQGKGNKDRIVPMSHTLAQNIKRYFDERKASNKTCPEFFVSSNRNCAFTETGIKRLVEKIRLASGLNFSIHKLRHTFATLMLEGGCDIYSLSKMMGHSDIKTTTIYLAASTQHLRLQVMKHPLNNPIF